jgi:GTPase SAR1 family protein
MYSRVASLLKSSAFVHAFPSTRSLTALTLIHSEPTVFENYVHDLYVDDQVVELSLWDTAGM